MEVAKLKLKAPKSSKKKNKATIWPQRVLPIGEDDAYAAALAPRLAGAEEVFDKPSKSVKPLNPNDELNIRALSADRRRTWAVGYHVVGAVREHVVWYRANTPIAIDLQRMSEHIWGYHSPFRNSNVWSVEMLIQNFSSITSWADDNVSAQSEFHDLLNTLKPFYEMKVERVGRTVEQGEIEFDDLPFFFPSGTAIVVGDGHQMSAGIVVNSRIMTSYNGRLFVAEYKVIHAFGPSMQYGIMRGMLNAYGGRAKLNNLSIRRMTEDDRKWLTKRGRNFVRTVTGKGDTNGAPVGYNLYSGQLTQYSWLGARNFRAEGRIMVDYRTGMRMEEDVVRQIVEHWISGDHRTYGLVTEEDGETTRRENMIEEVPENELFMTAPSVIAFSFAAKRWGEVYVEHITPIEWADNSYDLLVLDDDLKRMVRSLVTHHRGSFSDIINGKGGGIIFLLHGEPGQGKTLTAETVAEMLHRPLYSVTVGELGIEPSELEESLRRILDVATAWDAVLLIDEADIFLEARDENDVLRNAMVGVFLRLLEYHQGVLFLTTNRVKNIDRAFYSRISFGIQYRGSDETKREKIWHNLLNAAGIEMPDEDIHTLAKHDLNGRQIKNVIRISQTLVKAEPEGAKLLPVFEDVIRSIEEFQSSIGNKEM